MILGSKFTFEQPPDTQVCIDMGFLPSYQDKLRLTGGDFNILDGTLKYKVY